MIREWTDAPPRPLPAWAVLLLLIVGGLVLLVALVIGGNAKCERLAGTAQACPTVAGQAWT